MCGILFCALVLVFSLSNVRLECPLPDPIPECFSQSEFNAEIELARDQLVMREQALLSSYSIPGFTLTEADTAYNHFFNQEVGQGPLQDNRIAVFTNAALKFLKSSRNYTKSQLRYCLNNISTSSFCVPKKINCDASTTNYYRFDGQCNNVNDPLKGAKNQPFIRLLADGFVDGINTPNVIAARIDSIIANEVKGRNEINIPDAPNEMMTFAGQIMTHEMMKTIKVQLTPDKKYPGFQCCNPKNDPKLASLIAINDFCFPISVKSNDPCYAAENVKCLNYIKSMSSLDNCKLNSTTMPINFHTPYLDLELIYHSGTIEHLESNNGKFDINNFQLLEHLLVEYDERSRMMPGLFRYLKFYLKFHNTLVVEIKTVKPWLSLADVIDLARKITTAAYQKVFLDLCVNFLPPKESSILFNLGECYDPTLDPQISLEFDIALRDFHYFIGDKFSAYNEDLFKVPNGIKGLIPQPVQLGMMLNNLTFVQKNECGITHGSIDFAWNIAGVGNNVLCKFMAPNQTSLGADLRSWDYQAGMEFGQSSYLEVLKTFNGFNKCDNEFTKKDFILHDTATQDFFAARYSTKLNNVAYTLGTDLEDKQGQLLGPTTSRVIADQMKRTICGDRFWFKHAPFFTKIHRARLNVISLLDIVCLSTNCGGTRVQAFPFNSAGPGNLKRVCPTERQILDVLDLKTW